MRGVEKSFPKVSRLLVLHIRRSDFERGALLSPFEICWFSIDPWSRCNELVLLEVCAEGPLEVILLTICWLLFLLFCNDDSNLDDIVSSRDVLLKNVKK